ncbi:MAG TPA: hypothetical protein VFB12_02645, partial [Ktedonobacteraceae bacterium]|nr:hypothetical protein [Ktedonobacteraceae bacterium]
MSSFRRADKRMRERLFVNTPTRQERPFRPLQVLFVGVVSMLLLGNVFSNWPMAVPHVLAAQSFAPAPGVTTYQQFVKLGRDSTYHGPVRQNLTAPATTGAATARAATSLKTSPKTVKSAEPAKMQPIKLALTGTQLTATQTGTALTQLGSDKRLEVQVPPGSLDASKAQVAGNTTSAGVVTTAGSGLTLQVTQHSGHTVGVSSVLGVYDLSFVDAQGHTVQGVNPRKAITLVYHYQPKELQSLGIDPGRVSLSWPTLIAAARKAK